MENIKKPFLVECQNGTDFTFLLWRFETIWGLVGANNEIGSPYFDPIRSCRVQGRRRRRIWRFERCERREKGTENVCRAWRETREIRISRARAHVKEDDDPARGWTLTRRYETPTTFHSFSNVFFFNPVAPIVISETFCIGKDQRRWCKRKRGNILIAIALNLVPSKSIQVCVQIYSKNSRVNV